MQTIHNIKNTQRFRSKLRKNLTEPEKLFWSKVRSNSIGYKFRRQHSIGLYIVDFYCPPLRLIIEIDGDSHAEDNTLKKDIERTAYLKKLNFYIKRYNNRDIINNIEGVMEDLINTIKKL